MVVLVRPFLVLVCPLVVLTCPLVVLVCSLVALVSPLVVSVCPLAVLVVLSAGLFINDLPQESISGLCFCDINLANYVDDTTPYAYYLENEKVIKLLEKDFDSHLIASQITF